MWGFLLPTLHRIILDKKASSKNSYIIQSSGPVMDKVFQSLLDICSIDAKITSKRDIDGIENTVVKRWDHWLLYISTQENKQQAKVLWKFIDGHKEIKTYLKQAIQEIREYLLALVKDNDRTKEYKDQFIILKRSAPPEFYQADGDAENKTYGSTRRSIQGLNETASYLNKKQINTKVFEPGAYTIIEQIQIFNECRGVIGVRGAEFSNLIWMKPRAKAIMLLPSNLYSYSIPQAFAEIMDLDFHILKTYGGKHPTLEPKLLYNIIKNNA